MRRTPFFGGIMPIESLEPRTVFAGGIDPSFGSSMGAIFDAPGKVPTLTDTAVDPLGRVVLAGYTQPSTKTGGRQMFIARLTADGAPDVGFGGFGTGTSVGTPRGIVQIQHIVASPDGSGYYAVGQLGTKGDSTWRLIKFTAGGRVDAAFGKNGVASIDLDVAALVVQADGKPIVIGQGSQGEIGGFLAARFTSAGRLDSGYGTDGYALVSSRSSDEDEAFSRSVGLSSASIDPGGRLLVTIESSTHSYDFDDEQFSNELVRLRGNGLRDLNSGGEFYSSLLAPDDLSRSSAAVARPDGNVAVLLGSDVLLAGARGQLSIKNGQRVSLGTILPGFDVRQAREGSIVATADSKLIIAGGTVSNSVRTATLIRLNADLSLDTTFGNAGKIMLPASATLNEARDLVLNPEGTITAFVRAGDDYSRRVDDVPVVRVFQDDRPVASLRSVQRKGEQLRFTLSVRGVNAVDRAKVGGDMFRVRAVGSGGAASPTLLASSDAGDGDALVNLFVRRPASLYDFVTLANRDVGSTGTLHPGVFATVRV